MKLYRHANELDEGHGRDIVHVLVVALKLLSVHVNGGDEALASDWCWNESTLVLCLILRCDHVHSRKALLVLQLILRYRYHLIKLCL